MVTLIGHFKNDYRSLCSLTVILSVKLVEGMLPLRLVIKGHTHSVMRVPPFSGDLNYPIIHQKRPMMMIRVRSMHPQASVLLAVTCGLLLACWDDL